MSNTFDQLTGRRANNGPRSEKEVAHRFKGNAEHALPQRPSVTGEEANNEVTRNIAIRCLARSFIHKPNMCARLRPDEVTFFRYLSRSTQRDHI